MIDLAGLTALRAVATEGSVVGAAQALGYTPSAVSQQVKRLERQSGVALLERVGRGVILTGAGHQLVEAGAQLLADLEQVQAGLHRQAGTVAGHLRLVAFSTAVRGLVAEAVAGLLADHPGLRVTLTEQEPWDTVAMVAEGRCDVGLVHSWGDVPLVVPDHVARHSVAADEGEVVLPRGHRLADREFLTPHDLLEEPWIATPEGTICREWLHRMYVGTARPPTIAHVSLEFDSHLALVRHGLGVALVPRLGRAPLGPDLVAVRVQDPVPVRDIVALHRRSMGASPAVGAVVERLAALGAQASVSPSSVS